MEVVICMLRGEPLDRLSREQGVEIRHLEKWRDKALTGMEASPTRGEGKPHEPIFSLDDPMYSGVPYARGGKTMMPSSVIGDDRRPLRAGKERPVSTIC